MAGPTRTVPLAEDPGKRGSPGLFSRAHYNSGSSASYHWYEYGCQNTPWRVLFAKVFGAKNADRPSEPFGVPKPKIPSPTEWERPSESTPMILFISVSLVLWPQSIRHEADTCEDSSTDEDVSLPPQRQRLDMSNRHFCHRAFHRHT